MSAYSEEYVHGLLAENERLRSQVDGVKAEAEAKVTNLACLYVAVTSVHGAIDRPTVLSSVQEIVTNLIGCEEMAIFETDAANGRLTLLASTGIDPGPYQEVSIGDGAIGRAAATGERLVRQDGGSLTVGGDEALTACIPLKVGGRVIGVLAVFRLLPHKGRLDSVDLDLFDVLAAHAASSLLFTRLYAEADGVIGAGA